MTTLLKSEILNKYWIDFIVCVSVSGKKICWIDFIVCVSVSGKKICWIDFIVC